MRFNNFHFLLHLIYHYILLWFVEYIRIHNRTRSNDKKREITQGKLTPNKEYKLTIISLEIIIAIIKESNMQMSTVISCFKQPSL